MQHLNIIAFANAMLSLSLGLAALKPIIVDNEIKIRKVACVTLVLDHRCTDGARAVPVYQHFLKYLNDPEKSMAEFEPPVKPTEAK